MELTCGHHRGRWVGKACWKGLLGSHIQMVCRSLSLLLVVVYGICSWVSGSYLHMYFGSTLCPDT